MDRTALADILFDYGKDRLLFRCSSGHQLVYASTKFGELVGNRRVEHDHRPGTVGRRPHGAELEAITRKSERRGAVTVRIVDKQLGNMVDTVHLITGFAADLYRLFTIRLLDPVEYLRELTTQEDRDDCGGRFVCTQPMGVRCTGNSRFE